MRWIPLLLLLPLPLLAQHEGHDHPEPAAGEPAHQEHAEQPSAAEPAGHEEHAAETAGRPPWIAPVVILLLLGAVAAPSAARKLGRERLAGPAAGALALAALALLALTRPVPQLGEEEHVEEGHDEAAEAMVEVDPSAIAALGLQTEVVAPASFEVELSATGRIIPLEHRVAHLGPRLSGRLTSVRVKIGERVEAGQIVATLDSVDAAQAAAAWRESVARHDAAVRTLANKRQLAASGVYTAAPLEDARRQGAEARTGRAQVQSELAQAKNEADAAAAELNRTQRLVASGTYTTAAVEEARQKVSEAERSLAEAQTVLAEAEADHTAAQGAVRIAAGRVDGAKALATRTASLAATGELDRGPLEQAQNTVAEARSMQTQLDAALAQARRQTTRGEELYRNELISLNELESRRTAVTELEAQRREAASAVANAEAAVGRQERISEARMTSGRAEQEARNAVAEAERELGAAEAGLAKAEARVQAVRGGLAPARQAVETAREGWQREQSLARDETRSEAALDDARLRVAQAGRIVEGKSREVAEADRRVGLAAATVKREEHLAQQRIRAREALLDSEREVRSAAIARDNAAEVLQLLGSSTSAAGASRGPVQLPVRSPIAGVVTAMEASVGEAVSPDDDLLTVIDLSEVYVEADVYEKDLPVVAEGQIVRVEVRTQPGEPFVGSVSSIGGQLDPTTRAAHVRAVLANPDGRLRPGMFATVGFVTEQSDQALSVPAAAVQEVEGRPTVFVQRSPDQFEPREVVVGRADGGRVSITSGLAPGEVIVTDGSYLLKSQRLKSELGEGHAD